MTLRLCFAPLALAALLAGCAGTPMTSSPMSASAPSAAATATLQPTRGNSTAGTVTFTQMGDHVMVSARVTGLKPNQEHGFHVHEKGDCSSGDGMSAGGHFNPTGKPHGPQAGEHHTGDMPNLKADANGNAQASFHLMGVSIGSGATDIVGKGLIVHTNADDYATQPTGNAGGRIACAVIQKV